MSNYEEKTQQYSTWGDKLLQHTDVLHSIQFEKKFKPITVQLALCEVCDSNCSFCSVDNRPLKSYISWPEIVKLLNDFKDLGAKSVELTGGGNPMLYRDREYDKNINDVVKLASQLQLKVGIITNSEKLGKHLKPEVYPMIDWIRVSLIKLHEGKDPEDYDFSGFPPEKLGLSYIIYDETTVDTIKRIARLVEINPTVKFVRLAGDALIEGYNKELKSRWEGVVRKVDQLEKFFIKDISDNDKPFSKGCYIGATRPYIAPNPDGGDYQVYICTSHVLTSQNYSLKYSLGKINDVKKIWDSMNDSYVKNGYPYSIGGTESWDSKCKTCFYNFNNQLLHAVSQTMPDKDFA